jgi:hypothetical protein
MLSNTSSFTRPTERLSRPSPHSALVFGPIGVHHALNGLVDLVEDEGAG